MPDPLRNIFLPGILISAIFWFIQRWIINTIECRLFSESIMKKYRKYYKDYLENVKVLLWSFNYLIIGMVVIWGFSGVYFHKEYLIGIVFFVLWHYYFAPDPLRKFIPVIKDLGGNSLETYRGAVKSFSIKKRFDPGSLDRFILSLSLEGSEDVVDFSGFANDLKEDYLPGDYVEVSVMPTAKVILSVVKIDDPIPLD